GGRGAVGPVREERAPRLTPSEVGLNAFRISFMGPDGNPNFGAFESKVAFNSRANEYFVVWRGDDVTDNEFEVYGQRLSAATGAPIGGKIRVSDMGPDGDPNFVASEPAVGYKPTTNEYLVVLHGHHNTRMLAGDEDELLVQR